MATPKRKKAPEEPRFRHHVERVAWLDPDLKGIDLLVLLAHLNYGNWHTGAKCHPGDHVEKRTGLGRSTVMRARARLLEDGWLVLVTEGGRKGGPRANEYRWQIPGGYATVDEWRAAEEEAEAERQEGRRAMIRATVDRWRDHMGRVDGGTGEAWAALERYIGHPLTLDYFHTAPDHEVGHLQRVCRSFRTKSNPDAPLKFQRTEAGGIEVLDLDEEARLAAEMEDL
jgi:hypothetical protein